MTKNAILKKIRKTLFCIFTLTLTFSMFSCSVSDSNDTQKNDTPTENTTNVESNKTQNIPEKNEEVKDNNNNQNEKENVTESNKQNEEQDKKQNTEMKKENNPESHIVIYGIGIRGKNIDNEGKMTSDSKNKFAILYNQTENEIDISNWEIKKAAFNTQTDSETYKSTFEIPASTIIKSKQYLLLTRDGFNAEMWEGDVSSDINQEGSAKLDFGTAGNHIVLVDAGDNVIDRIDYIELSKAKQETWERKYNELYITQKTNVSYIFRTNPDIDTNNSCDDFTSLTINDECILKNSLTID